MKTLNIDKTERDIELIKEFKVAKISEAMMGEIIVN